MITVSNIIKMFISIYIPFLLFNNRCDVWSVICHPRHHHVFTTFLYKKRLRNALRTDLPVTIRLADFHYSLFLKCLFTSVPSISVPFAYSSKFISLPPGQWIQSGCLVVNLKLSLWPSNAVVECYYGDKAVHASKATKRRHFPPVMPNLQRLCYLVKWM